MHIAYRISHIAKELFLCLLSAILLILSFPNFNLWFFAWFGFVPLFLALQNKSKGRAFLFSYLTGIIFWLGIIYWLVHVTLIGMIALVLYLALYFGIFGLIISTVDCRLSIARCPLLENVDRAIGNQQEDCKMILKDRSTIVFNA